MPGQRKRGRPEVVGLHQRRHGGSWCEPRRYTRQEEVEEVGPHGSNLTAISGISRKKKNQFCDLYKRKTWCCRSATLI